MGTETRYHYGTGSLTTGTYGTESKRIFRFLISVLEISSFLPPPGGAQTKLNIAGAHTAHAPTLPGPLPGHAISQERCRILPEKADMIIFLQKNG